MYAAALDAFYASAQAEPGGGGQLDVRDGAVTFAPPHVQVGAADAPFDIAVILALLALIIVVARLAGYAASRVGVPSVVGEIAAGVLLGPSLLGDRLSEAIVPLDSRPFLTLLAQVGLALFMFVVGLELDVSLVKGRGRVAASVSVASILLPFGLGIGLATILADTALRPDDAAFLPFALFFGAAMSVTAFPVLARILTDRRMHRTETGGLALACAATDDVLAWTLLAVVIGIAGSDGGNGWLTFLAIPFALAAIVLVRPALTALTRAHQKAGELSPTIMSVVLVGLLLFAATTEFLGVHFIFGAFLFGAIMPREQSAALRHEILVRLEQITVVLLLPVFFLVTGLKVDLRYLGLQNLLPMLAILTVAIVGKYVGAYVGARTAGVPHWQANALGILMNTRGLTELIILGVGKEQGLLDTELFTMMVVMALVTTVMTGPLLDRAYPVRRVNRDIAEAERLALGAEVRDRALVIAAPDQDGAVLVDAACGLLYGGRNPEIVVVALQAQNRRLEVGSGLTDELAEMAAAMERQQLLVRRGEDRGVPVRVIANPSASVEDDLRELVDVVAPQFVVARADDAIGRAVAQTAACPVQLVAGDLHDIAGGTPVLVTWTADADGDAAVVQAARLAAFLGSSLDVRGTGRRYDALTATLARRGVRLGGVEHPRPRSRSRRSTASPTSGCVPSSTPVRWTGPPSTSRCRARRSESPPARGPGVSASAACVLEGEGAVADTDPGALRQDVLAAGGQSLPVLRLGWVDVGAVGGGVVDQDDVPPPQLEPRVDPRDLVGRVLHRDAPRLTRADPVVGARVAAEQVVAVELEHRPVVEDDHAQWRADPVDELGVSWAMLIPQIPQNSWRGSLKWRFLQNTPRTCWTSSRWSSEGKTSRVSVMIGSGSWSPMSSRSLSSTEVESATWSSTGVGSRSPVSCRTGGVGEVTESSPVSSLISSGDPSSGPSSGSSSGAVSGTSIATGSASPRLGRHARTDGVPARCDDTGPQSQVCGGLCRVVDACLQ